MKASLLVLLSLLFVFTACSFFAEPASDVELPSLFSDNMVLQRDMPVPIWGTASPGGKVIVQMNGRTKKAVVQKDGRWKATLGKMAAGGPYELQVIGRDTTIFKNVMIGEVWLCSGQSNMEMPLAGWGKVNNYEQEIAAADYPNIRLLQIEHTLATKPTSDVRSAGWKTCSPASVAGFSATAYFFGRHLVKNLNIPIGLIHSSWGGTVVEAWTSAATLKQHPDFAEIVQKIQNNEFDEQGFMAPYMEKAVQWAQEAEKQIAALGGYDHGWQNADFNDSAWPTMELPRLWETAGLDVDGVVWFRKTVDLPAAWDGGDVTLSLGPINDCDITWFNGVKVGGTGHPLVPRFYKIPGSLVKAGPNVIVVQVLDIGNKGGLYGQPEQLSLTTASHDSISLAGTWRYKPDPLPIDLTKLPTLPDIPNTANRPTVLFNGMISPLIPYGIRGAIWYQGESNAGRAYQYRDLFKMLIRDWRSHWGVDFPFLFVQLANFMQPKPLPGDDAWAELREAQLMALSLPNTGMAVAIDIGDAKDIHPKNKQEVGRRLALNALGLVYGKDVVYSGPIYKSMSVEGNKIRLTFDHVDGGLTTPNNEKLTGFAVAGGDSIFTWADAEIDGETVVVSSPYVANPVAVRYAWAANPICNLYNKAGLPASPFRTDDWPGVTEKAR